MKKILHVSVVDNNAYEYVVSSFFKYITGIVHTLVYHDQFADKNLIFLANTSTIRYTILMEYI